MFNTLVPGLFIPVVGDVAVVAPVKAHVSVTTPQLSVTTAFGMFTDAVHVPASTFAVVLDGHVNTGCTLSVIVTVNEHVAELPAASATTYVTVVTPVLNICVPRLLIPVVGELSVVAPVIVHVNRVTAQLSAVVGFGTTTDALHALVEVNAVIFAGQVMVGFV